MLLLTETLLPSTNSAVFKTVTNGRVWISISGAIVGTVQLHYSFDNSTWIDYRQGVGGTAVAFTVVGVTTLELPAGLYFRIEQGAGADADIDIHIGGTGVAIVAT